MFGQVFLLSYTKYSLLYNLSHQFIAVKPRLITLRSSLYGTQTTWVINRGFPTIISVVVYIYYVYPCVTLQFLNFVSDVLVISPSWTTYKPQARLAHHEPFVIETCLEDAWKISPKIIDDVSV